MSNSAEVPWTDEQWARVNQVVQEEAGRARVAAGFLPLYGPLPPDTDFIRKEEMDDGPPRLGVVDRQVIQLATLQVPVSLRGAQIADPELRSVLALFRRAANVLGRLEDAVVFNGWPGPRRPPHAPPGAPPQVWEIHGVEPSTGLFDGAASHVTVHHVNVPGGAGGPARREFDLVRAVSEAIGELEEKGYFGPFAVVLGQRFFLAVQTPTIGLVLPQDRIMPFLGGGPLLRSTTLKPEQGIVVALGGSPVELVISKDVCLQFLQVTEHPRYQFRVYEKMALRIKASQAMRRLIP